MEWLTKEQRREKFFKEHPNYICENDYDWKSKKPIPRKYPKGEWPLGGLDNLREKIRIRDKYTCQKCGKEWQEGERRFDTHNKNFNDNYTYKQSKNMGEWTTVCHSCNGKLHKQFREKLL